MPENLICRQIENLCSRNTAVGCRAMRALETEVCRSGAVYEHIDRIFELLDDASSFVRTRAFMLIAQNSRWDNGDKTAAALERFEQLAAAEKSVAVRQYVQALPVIAKHRPDFKGRVIELLRGMDAARYPGNIGRMLREDIAAALRVLQ